MKYEEIYVKEFQSVEQLRKSLKEYFHFYNHERPHQNFHGETPAEIYYGKKTVTNGSLTRKPRQTLPTGIFCGTHSQGLCTLSLTAWGARK